MTYVLFFRFIKFRYKLVKEDTPFDQIDISDIDLGTIKKLTYRTYMLLYPF